MAKSSNAVRIGILGASGYTGAELLRLLARHPQAEIRVLTANAKAGKAVAEVFPHLAGIDLPMSMFNLAGATPAADGDFSFEPALP